MQVPTHLAKGAIGVPATGSEQRNVAIATVPEAIERQSIKEVGRRGPIVKVKAPWLAKIPSSNYARY